MKITAKVLAVKRVDFINDDGEPVKGHQVWVCAPSTESAWNGHEVMKIWVKDGDIHAGDAAALLHDDPVIIEFNRRGKPVITDFAPVIV